MPQEKSDAQSLQPISVVCGFLEFDRLCTSLNRL